MSSSATELLAIGMVSCKMDHSLSSSIIFLAVGSFLIDLHIMSLSLHLNACCPQERHHQHRLFCCFTHCSCHSASLYFSGMGTQTRPAPERQAQLLEQASPSPDCLKKGKYASAAVLLSKRKKDALSAFLQLPFSFSRGFGFPE